MRIAPAAWLISFALIAGCASRKNLDSQRQFLVQDPPRMSTFDAMIAQSALHPDQNIRQLLLQQGVSMSVHLVQIRDREQPHLHTRYDLTIMLVDGQGTLWLQGEPLKMKAGDVAVITKGTRHHFVNEGTAPASALVVFAPAYDESDREAVDEPESTVLISDP